MGDMSQSFTDKLAARIKETGSALCVGLDPRLGMDDLEAIPALLRKVVEETAPYAAAFKPNIAYFEAMAHGITPGLLATLLGTQPILTLLITERRFSAWRLARR